MFKHYTFITHVKRSENMFIHYTFITSVKRSENMFLHYASLFLSASKLANPESSGRGRRKAQLHLSAAVGPQHMGRAHPVARAVGIVRAGECVQENSWRARVH